MNATGGPTFNELEFVMDNDQMANADTSAVAGKGRPPRRLIFGGVVALVLIAGVLVVGNQVTGSRAGASVTSNGYTVTCASNKLGSSSASSPDKTLTTPTAGVGYVTYAWRLANGDINLVTSIYSSTNSTLTLATPPRSATVKATLKSNGTNSATTLATITVDCT
jgi:hypothetical protein